jgi:hypothetical protein
MGLWMPGTPGGGRARCPASRNSPSVSSRERHSGRTIIRSPFISRGMLFLPNIVSLLRCGPTTGTHLVRPPGNVSGGRLLASAVEGRRSGVRRETPIRDCDPKHHSPGLNLLDVAGPRLSNRRVASVYEYLVALLGLLRTYRMRSVFALGNVRSPEHRSSNYLRWKSDRHRLCSLAHSLASR